MKRSEIGKLIRQMTAVVLSAVLVLGTDCIPAAAKEKEVTPLDGEEVIETVSGDEPVTEGETEEELDGASSTGIYLDADMVAEIPAQSYTGSQITPEPVVSYGGEILERGVDYTVSYGKNIAVGKGVGTVKIEGKGDYATKSTIVKYFTINRRSINDSAVTVSGLESTEYTGVAIKPVVVSLYGTALGTSDVSVSYRNNVNVGTAKVTIKGIGGMTGTRTVTFQILQRDISDAAITEKEIPDQPYTGSVIKPVPTLYNTMNGNAKLSAKTDYTVSYENNLMPGDEEDPALVIITGKGNYTGTRQISFNITTIDISTLAIAKISNQVYTGEMITPEVAISNNGELLRETIDYTLSYTNNLNVGTATVTASGRAGTVYAGSSVSTTFNITQASLSTCTLINFGDVTYKSGQSVYTQIEDKNDDNRLTLRLPGGYELDPSTDYSIRYSGNVSTGSSVTYATMTITPLSSNFTGSISKSFRIVAGGKILLNDYNSEDLTIEGFNDGRQYLYDTSDRRDDVRKKGYYISPAISLYYKGEALKKGTDYTLTYKNNNKVGTASVTITAVSGSRFSGTRTEYYYIVGRPIFVLGYADNPYIVKSEIKDYAYTGSLITPGITIREITRQNNGKTGYRTLQEGRDYSLTYANNVDVGQASMTITGIGNYSGEDRETFNIVQRDIETLKAPTIEDYTYTGEQICPTVYLKNSGRYLLEDEDYTVTFDENTEAGTGTVYVQAMAGSQNYTGSAEYTFKILPRSISKTNAVISGLTTQTYTGYAIEPDLTLYAGGMLVPDSEYLVTYKNNVNIGKATVTVKARPVSMGGSGNFKGSITGSFKITGQSLQLTSASPVVTYDYTGKKRKVTVATLENDEGTTLVSGKDYSIKATSEVGVGTWPVTVTGKGIYAGSTATMYYAIQKKEVTSDILSVKITGSTKLGVSTSVRPAMVLKVAKRTLTKGTDYTVSYGDNTAPGTAKAYVTFVGNYSGTAVIPFTVYK